MVRFGNSPEDIARAARLLRNGGLVAFPTETVYGLGARADNPDAVARIFAAKGRPADHPLIVHLPHVGFLDQWARDIPSGARKLAETWWPGPITLILKRKDTVPDAVTGGQDTVGLRVPRHPIALALLREVATGVAAPSANRFGRISPTTAQHVIDELGDHIDAVIDGGQSEVGIESTILDFSRSLPVLLRPGHIAVTEIENLLQMPVGRLRNHDRSTPRAPGTLESHYAPETQVFLVSSEALRDTVIDSLGSPKQKPITVLARREPCSSDPLCHWIEMPRSPARFASQLYAALRRADRPECAAIIVEAVPEDEEWEGIRDRLNRAATTRKV